MSDREGSAARISTDQVAHLADLARIDLTDEEVRTLADDLAQIVDAVATVSGAVGKDTPATSHPMPLTNVFRPDEVRPSLSVDDALSNAPAREGDRFRVAPILGEEQQA